MGFAPFAGAYCIRPKHHRINANANHHNNITKSAQFRAYAIRPYGGANH